MPFGIDDAIIGGGLSLLGGLFGGRKKKQETTSSIDYVKMRKSAQAAGFNPLTALQNGGAQGFSTSVTSGGGLSAFEALSNAFGVYQGLKPDPVAEKNKVLQNALLEKELAKPTVANGNGLSSASSVVGGVVSGGGSYKSVARMGLSGRTIEPQKREQNLYIDVFDPTTGRWTSIPDPDLMDSTAWESANALAMIGAADATQNGLPAIGRGVKDMFVPSPSNSKSNPKKYRINPWSRF